MFAKMNYFRYENDINTGFWRSSFNNNLCQNATQTSEHLSYLGSSIFQFYFTELEKGNVNYCGSKGRNPKFSKSLLWSFTLCYVLYTLSHLVSS